MEIKINLTIKQIYEILCPKCREKLLNLASQEGSKDFASEQIKEMLEKQMKEK